ncbi:MAG: DNA mismatch repair protein MutS [Clostridia bacterium]|nr:DNA mismatch repair protein MutS [Clostridia bacterium]
MAEMTPMIQQYLDVKKEYPDAILFFRLGDFYEMFFDDAKTASRELELTLTGRNCGMEERAPMCGVPYHSADSYIARLVEKGYKVAICEQTEDPALAKGLVTREVTRIVTKGSVFETSMLDESKNNYLATVFLGAGEAGLCFTDISTGTLNLTAFSEKKPQERVINALGDYAPSELLLNPKCAADTRISDFVSQRLDAACEVPDDDYFSYESCLAVCDDQFSREKLDALLLTGNRAAISALGTTIKYLRTVQKNDVANLKEINFYSDAQYMALDFATKRNLEIVETIRGREKKGSLLWVLDKTRSAMGKRLLRAWLEKPLTNYTRIVKRQAAVEELAENSIVLSELSDALSAVFDIERLISRVIYESANGKELMALKQTIEQLPRIKAQLSSLQAPLLRQLDGSIDLLPELHDLIDAAIVDEPPFSIREGGVIRPGFNEELDALRDIEQGGTKYIAEIETREKERTGIPKLRIGYNRVFGYYIEVTNSYQALVPETYIRKQTLANCERYITQELKDLESKVLGARERIVKLEYEIFCQVRKTVADAYHRIRTTAVALATLDVLCAFARDAIEYNYVCPTMNDGDAIEIVEGRHPVVERMLKDAPFVPNDTYLNCDADRCAIITGPNMAGKSTYMRQVALICLMAQIGSFVPAKRANLCIVKSIFTRVGASDDLAGGQSTFMVEMSEVAAILKNADRHSLVIFDEVGRGTSTFDGMSIARAVLEYMADKKRIGAKTLFSTHYHELTDLENEIDGVRNYNISVKKRGDTLTFLRRIVRGKADGSYGIEAAKLAGVPAPVVNRARVILQSLEAQTGPAPIAAAAPAAAEDGPLQMSFAAARDDEIIDALKNIDTDTLTPLEALTTLHRLVQKARNE